MFETWMESSAAGHAAAWLLTYALHSTLFLALAGLISRRLANRRARLEEAVWRFALVAALVTVTVQLAAGWEPVGGRWALDQPAAAADQASRLTPPVPFSPPVDSSRPAAATRVARFETPAAPAGLPKPDLRSAVLGLWTLGALLLSLRWGWSYFRLKRHLRPRPEVVGGGMFGLLRELCAELGLSPLVRLTCSSRVSVPVALGLSRPEICVPPRALSHLEPEQQQGMLAHELAHLVRRDPFWLAFSRLLTGLLFFQPLNWVAFRRLRELSERLCDEWAVERTGRPLSLARCLTEVAAWSVRPARALPVPSMADRPSSLAQRIRHLLDDSRSPERRVRPLWLGAAMLALLVGVAAVAPGVYAATQTDAIQEPADAAVLADVAEPVEPTEPAEPAELAEDLDDPDDLDLDLDIDLEDGLDPDLERELERMGDDMEEAFGGFEGLAALDEFEGLAALAQLDSLKELGAFADFAVLSEADAKEMERIAEQSARLAGEISEKYAHEWEALAESVLAGMEPELERISEEINSKLEPELERISEQVNREMAPEIERISERVANELEPQIEKLRAEAERLRKEGGLSDAERERLRSQAREIARRARPTEEEMKALREVQHKQREEMRKFMAEHRDEIEAARRESRAHADAMREQIRQRLESDPQFRQLRERHRLESEQVRERHREEMKRHRERMRQDREREKEIQKEKEKEKEKKVEKEKVPA